MTTTRIQVKEMTWPDGVTLRALPFDDKSIADFRHAAAIEKPMSLRSDKPHIFFWNGWYRVSLWNRRGGDNGVWQAAHDHARKLNAALHGND